MILNEEQIVFFKKNGYLRLGNFVDEATQEDWRSQIWDTVGTTLETMNTRPPTPHALNGFTFNGVTEPAHFPPLLEVVDQLGGGQFGRGPDDHGGGGAPIIKWPYPEQLWEMPSSGHIDGYPPPVGWAPFMVGATTYLYDVEPRGGSFVYWPESHKSTHAYFRKYQEQIDGTFRDLGIGGEFTRRAPREPREFTARAGDTLLWHSYMCHTGSPNARRCPRFAVVVRFSHVRSEERKFRYEIPENLWKYWAV